METGVRYYISQEIMNYGNVYLGPRKLSNRGETLE